MVRPEMAKRAFRADIQGLRAVAVLAVIADHLFSYPRGGFVGVDVFFVLSGFLITGHLVQELESKGRISFGQFYKRRVKRILPAAVLVVAVTWLLSSLVLSAARARDIGVDSIWAMLFSANWRFATSGTDYFEASGPVSPLRHYWSLAVEEQFYFVWPLLMVLVYFLVRQSKDKLRPALTTTMLIVAVASFVWAIYETTASPSWAYFSTFSRAWELGVGALLAVTTVHLSRIPQHVRPILAYIGLGGLILSFLVVSADRLFPAPWAALPVISTAIVIASGTGGRPFHVVPLTNGPMSYVGNISYSLYLWHFPILVLLAAILDEGASYYSVALILTAGLSVASYHFVEQPLRGFSRAKLLGRVSKKMREPSKEKQVAGVAVLATLSAALVVFALQPSNPFQPSPLVVISAPIPNAVDAVQKHGLAADVDAALAATAWPELSPSVDQLDDSKPLEEAQGCGTLNVDDPSLCTFGDDALPEIVVLGDSTGLTLLPTVRAAFGGEYRIRTMSLPGCPIIDLDLRFKDAEKEGDCLLYRSAAIEQIKLTKPAFVLLTNTYSAALELKSAGGSVEAAKEWSTAISSLAKTLEEGGTRVLAVSPPPVGKQLEECATAMSAPADCVSRVPDIWNTIAKAESTAIGAQNYVNTKEFFCNADDACPSYVGSTPTKRDAVHTTRQYAVLIADEFKTKVLAALGE